ncbi:MAG: TerD family protein [Bacteroidia bacterium]
MAINLSKGQTINLDKNTNDLSMVTIGLGWKIRQKKKGFFGKMFGAEEADFDLDAMAFLLDENEKVRNFGYERDLGGGRKIGLVDSDVIFFNNLRHPSGAIWHTGDELKGGAGGDDERIVVKLDQIPPQYTKILFLVCIYQGRQKNQHFGQVENAFIRAVDAKGKEIARYGLSDDASYENNCSMVFGEVYRKDGEWKFRALGNAYYADSFVEILKQYV